MPRAISALTFLCISMTALQAVSAAEIRKIAACPGQSLTLASLAGKITASTRVCMKMVNSLDGKAADVDFWKIGTLGTIEKIGVKSGAACFDISIGPLDRQELRAGGFKSSTTIYMLEIDTSRNLQDTLQEHDYLLASIKLPPEDTYKSPFDACKPICERTPPPSAKPSKDIPRTAQCVWHCGPSGEWARSCPFSSPIDPKTQKPRSGGAN